MLQRAQMEDVLIYFKLHSTVWEDSQSGSNECQWQLEVQCHPCALKAGALQMVPQSVFAFSQEEEITSAFGVHCIRLEVQWITASPDNNVWVRECWEGMRWKTRFCISCSCPGKQLTHWSIQRLQTGTWFSVGSTCRWRLFSQVYLLMLPWNSGYIISCWILGKMT